MARIGTSSGQVEVVVDDLGGLEAGDVELDERL
jgi:hypothetical protein